MEEKIQIKVMGVDIEVPQGTTYAEVSKKFAKEFPYPVLVVKQDNRLRELSTPIVAGGEITFVDIRDMEGMRVYHRSVSFLMVAAVKELLGDATSVVIEHSLHKSLYCEIRIDDFHITEAFCKTLQQKMEEKVKKDLPIKRQYFPWEKAISLMEEQGMGGKAKLFRYRRSSTVDLYELDGYYDYFYGYMVPSCGYLWSFLLMPYENGFLIRFPDRKDPKDILPFHDPKKISGVFMEQMNWAALMGVDKVAELNEMISHGKFGDLVRINEALHEKKVAEIADKIRQKMDTVRVILIAGPSSSGKTTFANRLCVQLRVLGIKPHTISLDDYYINRDETPLDEFGNKDFENINALDIPLLNSDMQKLIAGEEVELPYYNFVTGKREYKGNRICLGDGEIIVMEGIHGLNDALTASIASENKFRIFISAMTQLNVDEHNRISTSDSRLIRRIVRDNQFRGRSAKETIGTWHTVTKGEEENIFPFQENADVIFNSATIYELSVLKTYLEPLLFCITQNEPEYVDAKRLINFLDYFLATGSNDIPNNSIIKEFVGGSCFKVT